MSDHTPSHAPEPTRPGRFKDEGDKFAFWIGLGLVVLWGPLFGFYCGTVFGSQHVVDLQIPDIENGLRGAAIGLVVGLLGFVTIVSVYPKRTAKDTEDWNEEFGHAHYGKHD